VDRRPVYGFETVQRPCGRAVRRRVALPVLRFLRGGTPDRLDGGLRPLPLRGRRPRGTAGLPLIERAKTRARAIRGASEAAR